MTAIVEGLTRFGDGSLADLRERLVKCAQELKARGLIEINEEDFLITSSASPEYDVGEQEAPIKLEQSVLDYAREEQQTDAPKMQAGDPPKDHANSVLGGSPEDEEILDLAAELQGVPEPAKQDANVVRPADTDELQRNPSTRMKPSRFMNILGKGRRSVWR